MKIKQILPLLLLVLMISSCGSKIGAGISTNVGNLLLIPGEGKQRGTGGYLGYGYQKMFDRHGVGVDFDFSIRGYQTLCIECYEGTDKLYHTIQAKYYYTLIESQSNSYRLDLALGIGGGKFTFNSRDRYYPAILSAGFDMYLSEKELVSLSSRVRYMSHLKSDEFNVGLELGIGFSFRGNDE